MATARHGHRACPGSSSRRSAMLLVLATLAALASLVATASGAQWQAAAPSRDLKTHQSSWTADAPRPADAPTDPRIPDLIDVLSASENHTILLRLFQRARLIPTLIMLQELGDGRGLTIFAPTDEAIVNKAVQERQTRHDAERSDNQLDASYWEGSIKPRTPWEWALYLATEGDDEHIPAPGGDDDFVMPVWYADATRLDNINAVLRQQLLYHMVNYTLPYNFTPDGFLELNDNESEPSLPELGHAAMLTTLHLPSRRLLHEPTRPGPVPQPPTRPPHPGAEDNGGLLGGEGQKVRIARGDKEGKRLLLGTNSRGEGGVSVVGANVSSPKGVVLSIDGILDLPPSFDAVLKTHPDLQYLLNLTSIDATHSLSQSAHSTFLLPKSEAFEVLSKTEHAYLSGDWPLAAQDRLKLFGQHMSGIGLGLGKVAYAERLRDVGLFNMTTIFGGELLVNATGDEDIKAGKATVIEEDILTENGVIHIVDRLLLQYDDLGLSVEKTLLALNASKWVSLMRAEGLTSYIDKSPNGNDEPDETIDPWTFLVPRDDVIKTWLDGREQEQKSTYYLDKWRMPQEDIQHDGDDDIAPRKTSMRETLLYHIAPNMLQPQNLSDGMLVGTELRGWKLRDARQRLLVGVDESAGSNDRQGNGDVGFGDANVIATPIKVGPSIIYLISNILEPPTNPIQTAVSSLALSTFVATVFSAELDKPIKRAPAVTYVVPHNDAFSALGLAMPYLLLDQAKPREELRSMVEYHAIDEIVYMEDFTNSSRRYPTLEGSPIWAGRDENGTIDVRRGTTGRNARVIKGDILTSTGVLHEIDQVELPPTLDLTIEKLMKGAKADTMRDLVQQAGYGWILNGTTPSEEQYASLFSGKFPDGKKPKRDRKRHKKRHHMLHNRDQSFTVLCPTDSAFTRVNLTYYYEDRDALRELVQMHIIPSPANQSPLPDGGSAKQLPIGIRDAANFPTLLDASMGGTSKYGKVAFRKLAPPEDAPPTYGRFASSTAPRDEEPGLGWMVGVADTRGTDGRKTSARVLNFGRESLALEQDALAGTSDLSSLVRKRRNRDPTSGVPPLPQSIGGILTIDAVLHPYTPGWFYRWGWIAALCTALAVVLAGGGYGVYMWWHRDGRIRLPEALDGEEE